MPLHRTHHSHTTGSEIHDVLRSYASNTTRPLSAPLTIRLTHTTPSPPRSPSLSAADVHAKFVAAQSLTMCELLEAFPSCKPRAGPFLGLLPPLPPRYYSVASSQLATPGSLSVAFSVVSYSFPTSLDSGSGCVTRKGLCTNWLEDILTPFLVGNEGRVSNGGQAGATKGMVVPIFIKPTKEFLLPASAKWPCVLIGPGTG